MKPERRRDNVIRRNGHEKSGAILIRDSLRAHRISIGLVFFFRAAGFPHENRAPNGQSIDTHVRGRPRGTGGAKTRRMRAARQVLDGANASGTRRSNRNAPGRREKVPRSRDCQIFDGDYRA